MTGHIGRCFVHLTSSSNQACLGLVQNGVICLLFVCLWFLLVFCCFIADSGVGSTAISDVLSNQHSIPYQSLPEPISTAQKVYSTPMQPVAHMQQAAFQQQTAQSIQQATQLVQGAQPQQTAQLHQGAQQEPTMQLHPGVQQQQTTQLQQAAQQQQQPTAQLKQGVYLQTATQLHQGVQQEPTVQLHLGAQQQQTTQLLQGAYQQPSLQLHQGTYQQSPPVSVFSVLMFMLLLFSPSFMVSLYFMK